MSVKTRKWTKKDGSVTEVFVVSFTYTHPDGTKERVREVTDAKTGRQAEQYEDRIRLELRNGMRGKKAVPEATKVVPTLTDFGPRFMDGYAKANQQKPSTVASKQAILDTYLVPFFGQKALDAVTEEDVQHLKGKLKELSPKTVNNVLSVFNTLMKQAVAWKVIKARPEVKLLKVPKTEVGFYESDEYERLTTAARGLDPRIELMVLLGGDAGLRCGEIIALEWGDIDTKRHVIKVQRSERLGWVTATKSGRVRQVRMTARLEAALEAHRHKQSARVLCRDGGTQVTREVLCGWMKKAQSKVGIKATGGLHILRHTFCSRLAMFGATIMQIKELAGHQDIVTTQRYMHLSPTARDSAIGLLDRATTTAAQPTAQAQEVWRAAGVAQDWHGETRRPGNP